MIIPTVIGSNRHILYLQGEFDCLRGGHHWQEVGEALQGGQTDVVARVAVGGAGGRAAVVSVAATAGTKIEGKMYQLAI